MTSTTVRTILLMGATMTMGLAAGAFVIYAHTIMPGLRNTDDRTFVGAFQATDRAIINPWFMLSAFLGALVLTIAGVIFHHGAPALPWIAAALGLYVLAVIVTMAVNVPLNNVIKAAGDPSHIPNLAHIRQQFHETRWAAWNLLRAVTTTTAFGLLAWALVLHGRATR
jgi:uncharacterized membrane protein